MKTIKVRFVKRGKENPEFLIQEKKLFLNPEIIKEIKIKKTEKDRKDKYKFRIY